MIKKIISTFLVAAMIASSFAVIGFAAENSIKFSDVDANSEMGKAIYKLVNAGIVHGNGDGTFTPNNNVTRAELCKMVNNVFKYTKPAVAGFSDVTEDKWYYNHVLIAKEAGYINGFPDGTFRGDDNVTREQVCAILYRVDNMNMATDAPVVRDEISEWAIIYVMAILNKGLIPLEEGNTFRATEDMKRGEVALVLAKYIPETSKPITVIVPGSSSGSSSGSSGGSSSGSSSGSSGGSSGSSSGSSKPSTGDKEDDKDDKDDNKEDDNQGGSTTPGGSTGGNTGSTTPGGNEPDVDPDEPEVKDYTEDNAEIVASLKSARDDLKLPANYNKFTSGEKKIINSVVDVIDDVIAEDDKYLITKASIFARYDSDILEAVNKFAQFSEDAQATFISKMSSLDEETFDFLCLFFGIDPDDYSDVLDKIDEIEEAQN